MDISYRLKMTSYDNKQFHRIDNDQGWFEFCRNKNEILDDRLKVDLESDIVVVESGVNGFSCVLFCLNIF